MRNGTQFALDAAFCHNNLLKRSR